MFGIALKKRHLKQCIKMILNLMDIHLYKLDQMRGAISVIVEYINIYFDYKIVSLRCNGA
jgi:hypothetical protein